MKNIYELTAGDWRACVERTRGGNVISLTYGSRYVLVPLTSEAQYEENPYIQGVPMLLPANRTAEGTFVFDGRKYTLPVNEPATGAHLHGFLYKQTFEVVKVDQSTITLTYENHGEIYPFPFRINVVYSLDDGGFSQTYEIENTGDTDMPVTFALHTSFSEPDCFFVPIDACFEKDGRHIPTGRYVPLNEQEQRYAYSSVSKGIVISGYYRSCGSTACVGDWKYTVSSEFDHWILFNGQGGKGLLCVEPQCGKVNGLNAEDGHRRIAPGKKLTLATRIEVFV